MSFLGTATMPMILNLVGTALFAKLLVMVCRDIPLNSMDCKINNSLPGQDTVRMPTNKEREEFREVRPGNPF
ncbi:hypothetical protein NC651_016587 [Populus alba x Populus x berolinensis]|nr:hypothetical protein NC651_016587 [Populus alba x Populus x berolinensis]